MTSQLMKIANGDFEVVYELDEIVPRDYSKNKKYSLAEIDQHICELNAEIERLDTEIDKLVCHADAFDYAIAAGCGVLTGIIDSFYVGEIDWGNSRANAHKTINNFIEKQARNRGYKGDKGLEGAINYLESQYKIPSDNIWSGQGISSTKTHHLDDLAHHPTPIGLVANVVTTLFRVGVFVNKDGKWHFTLAETDFKELAKIWTPIILSAVLHWFVNIAECKYSEEQQKEIPKPIRVLLRMLASAPAAIELLKITNNWVGHLISDMGGSKNTPGGGMGIPGLFLSLLKEISSVPGINKTSLPQLVNKWYRDDHFDMRKEYAIFNIAKKQAVPVLINEILVRGIYFVRRIIIEAKLHGRNWEKYDWEKTVPFSNRTIVRMLTVSHGTFVAVDLADAAARTAVSGQYVDVGTFMAKMALRINFVGVGRLTLACWSEVKMACQDGNLRRRRINDYSELMQWSNTKFFLLQENTWVAAANAEQAIQSLLTTTQRAMHYYADSHIEIHDNLSKINSFSSGIDKHNPGLKLKIIKCLEE